MTKRALLLISDTGGGHRSAANAIAAALDEIASPHSFEHRIEDVAAHCAFPLTQLGLGYSMALRYAPPVYGALYYATNGRRRYRALVRFCEPLYRERLRDLFIGYQPDVIVSVHPLLNHAALRARDDAQHATRPDRHGHHRSRQGARVVARRRTPMRSSCRRAKSISARSRAAFRRRVCTCSAIRSIRSLTTSPAARPTFAQQLKLPRGCVRSSC